MTEAHVEGAEPAQVETGPIKVLLVDDEDRFRQNLAQRLTLRGFSVRDVGDGEEAIRLVRSDRPDVIVLDRKMPKMQGEEVLKEVKKMAPEVQVIMLTGHASIESATSIGRLDAFAYLEKPCETEELIATIRRARQERVYAMARNEIPTVQGTSAWTWLKGTNNSRPGILILGAAVFSLIAFTPASDNLLALLRASKTGDRSDVIAGYADYRKMKPGDTIASQYSEKSKRYVKEQGPDGKELKKPLPPEQVARSAKVMIGILVVAALFWAFGAMPLGFTSLTVAVLMYLFNVFPPDGVAQAFAKDSVLFILGVLAFAIGLSKTGLDKRIGLILLGTSHSLKLFAFVFLPSLAIVAGFLSEHALVAFLAPLLMVVYMSAIRGAGISRDRNLAVFFMLGLSLAANHGGPGSPAAGGRNAVMIGILSDYGIAPTFGQWVMYGMPFVPVCTVLIGAYLYFAIGRRAQVKNLDVAAVVRREAKKLGVMNRDEKISLAILLLVVTLWITASDRLGMGGPVALGLVLMSVFRIVTWRDISKISWDVVALYGSATAIGAGLAATGAALWMASAFVNALPEALSSGAGLAIASSFITGVLTNFMSDGATVSAVGPITVPMAALSGTHPWMVGLATAFASSFANCLIIGTPNNAIAYSLARDLNTGEQLLTLGDFAKHGAVITCIAFAVLWFWTILGYWQWIGF
ncbi:MAG: SLC13 family permease [Pseudomonadota bacterium]